MLTKEAVRLRFRFEAEKFVSAVAYLAQRREACTKLDVCALLYFADKEHLVRYGRPITGDDYCKLPSGPAPSCGLELLRGKGTAADRALLEKFVSVLGNELYPRRRHDRMVFSRSDVEALAWAVKKFGKWPAPRLSAEACGQLPWQRSANSGPIDFALFFEDSPGSELIRELAEEEQESRDLLRPYEYR